MNQDAGALLNHPVPALVSFEVVHREQVIGIGLALRGYVYHYGRHDELRKGDVGNPSFALRKMNRRVEMRAAVLPARL